MTRGVVAARSTSAPRAILEALEGRQMLAAANAFLQNDLVSSNGVAGTVTDTDLINAWGLAINQTNGAIWVSDAESHKSTAYDDTGVKVPIVVAIPHGSASTEANPTGVVFNTTNNFVIGNGANSDKALYLFASEDGTISGWNPTVDQNNAVLVVDRSAAGAVYKGLALGKNKGKNLIYAANFHSGRIDVFDKSFQPASLKGHFGDRTLPAGMASFNIQNINNQLFVTYAKQDAAKHDDVPGAGSGVVDVFSTAGKLLHRFTAGGKLNSPWAVVQAPSGFGPFANDILVGNFGDGKINVFRENGTFVAPLKDKQKHAISIDGLWGLQFGNGTNAGTKTTLFFAAGPEDESQGLFGKLTPAKKR